MEITYPWFCGEQDAGTCCSAKKPQTGQLQSCWTGGAVLCEANLFPSNQSIGSLHWTSKRQNRDVSWLLMLEGQSWNRARQTWLHYKIKLYIIPSSATIIPLTLSFTPLLHRHLQSQPLILCGTAGTSVLSLEPEGEQLLTQLIFP